MLLYELKDEQYYFIYLRFTIILIINYYLIFNCFNFHAGSWNNSQNRTKTKLMSSTIILQNMLVNQKQEYTHSDFFAKVIKNGHIKIKRNS